MMATANNETSSASDLGLHDVAFVDGPLPAQLRAQVFVLETEILVYHFMYVSYNISAKRKPAGGGPLEWEDKCGLIQDARFRLVLHALDADTDTNVFVAASEDRVMVGFRGTVSLANVRTDIDSALVRHPLGHRVKPLLGRARSSAEHARASSPAFVHQGFLTAYNSVRSQVVAAVSSLVRENPRRVVFVTGHSLGGGLACLCAFDFAVALKIPVDHLALTTWGCPRVGNYSFARRFARAVPVATRFVCEGDIITRLPFTPPFQDVTFHGWFHCGVEVLLKPSGVSLTT